MTDPQVEVSDRKVVFDGFFRIVRFRLRHRLFAGGMGPELVRELCERGAAVVVLPYDPEREQVVLVEQFRLGALEREREPWLLEPVAGMMEVDESAPEVARREALEEAGLELLDLVPIGRYYPSPGGSSEVCEAFIARVDSRGAGGLFGLADHGEDVRAHVVPLPTALAWLDSGRIPVASTIITLQWLALHRAELEARWRLGAGDSGASSRANRGRPPGEA
ncbi:MAG TPA: NUDIX domain-containing protein [Geminicoccaceae bacterium]|nr:NUDIX domain-containing protein [Geminicoccaceae bacterium]